MPTARIDPDLSRALSGETPDGSLLNVFLKIAFPSNVRSASGRADKAAALIRRVERAGETGTKFQFRALDNVLQVMARTELIRRLIREPEVISASHVPRSGSALINPVERREVSADAIDRPIRDSKRTGSRRSRAR